jgi:hypothetical protein
MSATMLGSSKLQEVIAEKEKARVRHKQMVEKERLVRLGIYHQNKCNVDTEYLDQQCEEKRQNRADEAAYNTMQREHAEAVEQELLDNDGDEYTIREQTRTEVMKNWEDSIVAKKQKEAEERAVKDFDMDVAGPSSMLYFAGESTNYYANNRQKKTLQREYVREQLAEKAEEKAMQELEEDKYVEVMKFVHEMRGEAENDVRELKQYISHSVKDHNLSLAASAKARREIERADAKKPGGNLIKSLLEEDKQAAINSNGRVYRRDMFKGFTVAQQKRIMSENQDQVDAKLNMDIMRSNNDYEWSLQQDLQLKAMEATEYDERTKREAMNR